MKINLAIVGSTGLVGQEILKILDQRKIKIDSLKLLASKRSAGKEIDFRGKKYIVEEAKPESFTDVNVAIFSAESDVSKLLAKEAVKRSCIVIDNSNAFRMDNDVPLVVPEVNPEAAFNHKGIIANPNCSTIQMVVALKPLYDFSLIKNIWVSTYQSVSGTGYKGIDELRRLSLKSLNKEDLKSEVYPKPISFNLLPHIDIFLDNGYSREEMKMVNETKKILQDPNIQIEPTAVRVPVLNCHSEAITIETKETITKEIAINLFEKAPGITVMDNLKEEVYPTPLDVNGKDNVYVGRIRKALISKNALSMWVVGDNLRKGAALNAIQILELLSEKGCLK
ncbi:aspartate-semialdehyde dehydrogenase [Mycoplasmatota bacterium]|nr:aspartate-semialdehyde dehydrogenase [Mycoplasmatota bacterium]